MIPTGILTPPSPFHPPSSFFYKNLCIEKNIKIILEEKRHVVVIEIIFEKQSHQSLAVPPEFFL
jgi:hypothetical protein